MKKLIGIAIAATLSVMMVVSGIGVTMVQCHHSGTSMVLPIGFDNMDMNDMGMNSDDATKNDCKSPMPMKGCMKVTLSKIETLQQATQFLPSLQAAAVAVLPQLLAIAVPSPLVVEQHLLFPATRPGAPPPRAWLSKISVLTI